MGVQVLPPNAPTIRFALYDTSGHLIREIPHEDGQFAEPVEVKAGESLRMVVGVDEQTVVFDCPMTLTHGVSR